MSQRIPNMQELTRYDVNRRDEFEVVKDSLYHYQTYAAAGQTSLTFFQTPVGQAGNTLEETNMELAGQLPAPKNFLVDSIEIIFYPNDLPVTEQNTATTDFVGSDAANDVYTALKLGFLDFFIGSKSYLTQASLMRFPPKTRLQVDAAFMGQMKQTSAADETTAVMADYATALGRPYITDPRLRLIPTQNFKVTLTWAALQALPSGAAARMGVILDGLLYRESQ